jgi:hypothetical protein
VTVRTVTIEHEVVRPKERIVAIATNKHLILNILISEEYVCTVALSDIEAGKLAEVCKQVSVP